MSIEFRIQYSDPSMATSVAKVWAQMTILVRVEQQTIICNNEEKPLHFYLLYPKGHKASPDFLTLNA
jgi:hypothetical protein